MRRLELTHHTVRCPLEDCAASLTVQTDSGRPAPRHLDVTACSLLPPTSFVAPAWKGHFSDVAPPLSYVREAGGVPRHSAKITCSKRCLAVLNAAEAGTAEPLVCSSGINDSLELARRTQSAAMMRVLWSYFA